MEQQGTVNNRTFVLLNFRSIIVAIPTFLCADPMGLHESSYDTSVPRYNPMESSAFLPSPEHFTDKLVCFAYLLA